MTRPLGRRRYAALLRFLNETIGDASLPHGSRLQAAQTLAAVLGDRDRADERTELSLQRAAARQAASETRMAELALAEKGIRLDVPPPTVRDAENAAIADRSRADKEERRLFDRLLSAPEDRA